MGWIALEHGGGREVYGDEPRYSEEYLASGTAFDHFDDEVVTRRVMPPQFDDRGRLILPRNTDATNGTGYLAFLDCLIERREYCRVERLPPAQAMRTPMWPETVAVQAEAA